jgi:hypothetical protein
MLERILQEYPWLGGLTWAVVYLLDWVMTVATARSYDRLEGQFYGYEQLELNPILQKAVAGRRYWSPRFLMLWTGSAAFIGLYCWMVVAWNLLDFAIVVVGALSLFQAVVLFRHVRALLLFRVLRRSGGVEGRIHHSQWFSLRAFADESVLFGALFLGIAAVEESLFLLAGGCTCILAGLRARLRSGILRRRSDPSNQQEVAPS